MKAILIPVDFSKSSETAALYAIQMAIETKARIVFFHAYAIPVTTMNMLLGNEILLELEHTSLKELAEYSASLLGNVKKSTQVEFHNEVRPGFMHTHLQDVIKTFNIDIIVMGTKGQSRLMKKIFIGSNALSVLEKSSVSVLVIPEKSNYKPVHKVVFATNLENQGMQKLVEPLFEWSWLHPMELHFLVVIPPGSEMHSAIQLQTYIDLEGTFGHLPHFLEIIESTNVPEAIDTYMHEIKADMLVTIPGKHDLLEKLFNHSVTREMVFHTDIPILCLK